MAKPSKKTLEPLVDEWARNEVKRVRIIAQRDREIQPLTEAYEKKCSPINATAKEKLDPIDARLNELSAEISKQLMAGVGEDGSIALAQVATDAAIAEVKTTPGAREINPERFFDQVVAAKRDSRFWACVKIHVGKAEKLMGDVINSIAKKPTATRVEIKLRG